MASEKLPSSLAPLDPTPIHGHWSDWSSWSACSQQCYGQGLGIRSRHRNCTNPAPAFGGKHCPNGLYSEDHFCPNNCPGKFWKFKMFNQGQNNYQNNCRFFFVGFLASHCFCFCCCSVLLFNCSSCCCLFCLQASSLNSFS